MGCDIHLFIEKRDDPSNEWRLDEGHTKDDDEHDSNGKLTYEGIHNDVTASCRNYQIFNVMAGVRGGGSPLGFEPRGIPDDASPEYKAVVSHYNGDGHSHSFLSLEEFKQILIHTNYLPTKNMSTRAFYEYGEFKSYKDAPEDYTTVLNYVRKWIDEQWNSYADIDERLRPEPEVRFVFFFDN